MLVGSPLSGVREPKRPSSKWSRPERWTPRSQMPERTALERATPQRATNKRATPKGPAPRGRHPKMQYRGANSGAVARRVGVDVEGLGQPGWIGTPHSPSCMNGRTDGYYMSELF